MTSGIVSMARSRSNSISSTASSNSTSSDSGDESSQNTAPPRSTAQLEVTPRSQQPPVRPADQRKRTETDAALHHVPPTAASIPVPTVSASSGDVNIDLLAEIICDVADFTVELALKVAARTGHNWTPRLLQRQAAGGVGKKGKGNKPYRDPQKPRRPPSSYTLWCEHIRNKAREMEPTRTLKLADLAEMWKRLPSLEKDPWEDKAKIKKAEWQQEMKVYQANTAAAAAKGEDNDL